MGKGKAKSKAGKPSDQLKDFVKDPKETDLVVAVMGRTGAGKSTFVNNLCRREVASTQASDDGDVLASVTQTVQHYEFHHPEHTERRLLVIDTPGFDDRDVSETDILENIGYWLAHSYKANMKLAGLVYIFDITSPRIGASESKSYKIFEALCGKGFAPKVVLATSKWGLTNEKEAKKKEKALIDKYWSKMYEDGSTVHRLGRSPPDSLGESEEEELEVSARKVINTILSQSFIGYAAIQEELVKGGKDITETAAGKIVAGKEEETKSGFSWRSIFNRK